MNIIYILFAVAVTLFLVSRLMSQGGKSITTAELKQMLAEKDKSKFYMDVRTPGEFKGNHIKTFKNIPLGDLQNRMNQIPKDKQLVVICQSGARSSAACRQLRSAGYEDIINVQGGMNQWR